MSEVLHTLSRNQPIAHAVLTLACVAVAGLVLGAVKYRGIGLGTAGVLFAGILFGHFGEQVDHTVLDFVKEFGLILFVFTIGLQLGPGFFAALRQQGLQLNALALAIVALGALAAVAMTIWMGVDGPAALGLFSGATTNTPSLGAAQQALASMPSHQAGQDADLPALAYAVAYPAGIVGIILSLVLLRGAYRIDAAAEAKSLLDQQRSRVEPVERLNIAITNPQFAGTTIAQLPEHRDGRVMISRIRRANETAVRMATAETEVQAGDVLLAVGSRSALDRLARAVGKVSDTDLMKSPGPVSSRRVVVTRREALGKTIAELPLEHAHGVVVTRVSRADLEMTAVPELRLRFGDVLQLVGEPEGIKAAGAVVGDSVRALNETQFIPLFIGIALGVVVGLLPVAIPGLPAPVRLGLAGGPLTVGITLARMGHIGGLVWHMPLNANLAFRELGITLFLAAVGLKAGERFFETVFSPTGLLWLGCAALVAVVPLMLVGIFARSWLKLNFAVISGLIAGSTTDPPALAFAGSMARSDAPHVAYATVYPLTMLLRILSAQALALALC